ncbi:type II secretion system F family protein [Streptomyces sp. SCA3-4]|uniref:type II secretion system F family protein n=1 Tax=Streptomyces sichuanensis TaxID=2871810 RepID=UPI001CE30C30|nr:type II secretion system F family protein [Streptomyces sichuanensis]MCA6092246.1 type II secretion system F family protein [Streptomyces sichuanensis]
MSGQLVHSLWAAGLVVAAVACVAARGSRSRRARSTRRRMHTLVGGRTPAANGQGLPVRLRRMVAARGGRTTVAVAIGGLLLVGIVGGAMGCVVGLVAAAGVWRWRRKAEPAGEGVSAEEVGCRLPLAADLLAACLAAGAGPREAAEAVGGSLGGPVGERLAQAAAEVRLGGEPAAAWGRLGALPGAAGTARCLERAQTTGVPAVEPMTRLAAQLRAAQARAAGIRARRAGVLATAPLGLCFLPAFLTVGVAPVVVGLASVLLQGN